MQHMQDSIHIDAPIEHVWAFALDTSHWPDWQPRMKSSDFSGPLDQVGTTYVQVGRILGYEMKFTNEVVEVVPQRLYHERTDMGPMDTYLRFEPEGGGTLLTMESDYEMPGRLPGFVKDLMSRSWIERQTRQMLQDLKALAEATVPVPA
jgi:uncharacterized membrane protein